MVHLFCLGVNLVTSLLSSIENTGCGIMSLSHTPKQALLRTLVMLNLGLRPSLNITQCSQVGLVWGMGHWYSAVKMFFSWVVRKVLVLLLLWSLPPPTALACPWKLPQKKLVVWDKKKTQPKPLILAKCIYLINIPIYQYSTSWVTKIFTDWKGFNIFVTIIFEILWNATSQPGLVVIFRSRL